MRLSKTKLIVSLAALLCAVAAGTATGDKLVISTKADFMDFVAKMNTDCSFESTVVLARDINVNETIPPIGFSTATGCVGTFDGQGHILRNLTIEANDTTPYAGLFSAMRAGTVKDVLLDGSCSITSAYAGASDAVYVGSIVGAVLPEAGEAVTIEDCVSAASVTYNGGSSGTKAVAIGGIVGGAVGSTATVQRCANYGPIAAAGGASAGYLGGIVGRATAEGTCAIDGCSNSGAITEAITSSTKYAGGILGHSDAETLSSITYTVSTGAIAATGSTADPIAGVIENGTVSSCFYSSTLGSTTQQGCESFDPADVSAVLSELNGGSAQWSHVTLRYDMGELVLGENKAAMMCSDSDATTCATHLVPKGHLPPIAGPSAEKAFAGWFADAARKNASKVTPGNLSESATLYAGFGFRALVWKDNVTVLDDLFAAGETFEVELDDKGCKRMEWNASGTEDEPECTGGECTMAARDVEFVVAHIMYTISLFDSTNITEPAMEVPVKCGDILNMEPYKLESEDRNFSGWTLDVFCTLVTPESSTITQNMSLYGCWGNNRTRPIGESSSSSEKAAKAKDGGSNVGVIVGTTVSVLVIVIIAIVVVIFLIMRMRTAAAAAGYDDDDDDEGYVTDRKDGAIEMRERPEVSYVTVIPQDGAAAAGFVSLNDNKDLYSECYHIPTIEQALTAAGLSGDPLKKIVTTCRAKAKAVAPSLTDGSGPTEDDIAAVAMYTFDFGARHYESNPFRLINKELAGQDKEGLKRISGMLYLVLTALRKLPRVTKRTLYRGVRQDANIKEGQYAEGSTVTWSAFSSTSPDMNTTKAFLAKGSSDGKAAGTLFIIEHGWGYDLQPYSLYPNETEILLEPERQFKVTSVLNGELVIVTLEMIDSKPVLPEIFGEPIDTSV